MALTPCFHKVFCHEKTAYEAADAYRHAIFAASPKRFLRIAGKFDLVPGYNIGIHCENVAQPLLHIEMN